MIYNVIPEVREKQQNGILETIWVVTMGRPLIRKCFGVYKDCQYHSEEKRCEHHSSVVLPR